MFGLLGDGADASSDSSASDIISTIGHNITDTLSQAASSASEFFPELVHGSLRALQAAGSGSGTGEGDDGGHGAPGWAVALAIIIPIGVFATCIWWCCCKKDSAKNFKYDFKVTNPLAQKTDSWGSVHLIV